MLSLQKLQYYQKVCETRSINSAARELFISQSTLSIAVKDLETELGVTLLERSKQGIQLTPEGELLYHYCESLSHQIRMIEYIGKDRGRRLGLSVFPGFVFPDTFVKMKLLPEYRDLHIDCEECRVDVILERVSKGLSEVGITQTNNKQLPIIRRLLEINDLEMLPLVTADWAIAVGPNSPLYDRESVTVQELLPYTQLRLRDDLFSSRLGDTSFGGVKLNELRHDFHNSTFMINYLLEHTDAYTLHFYCGAFASSDTLGRGIRVIRVSDSGIRVTVSAVTRRSHVLSDAAQTFLSLLREQWPEQEASADF